nr:PAS domain-containing hybrid sensor histidine kinase/response regulator [Pseudenhygromyxa sp. WMMC2535]
MSRSRAWREGGRSGAFVEAAKVVAELVGVEQVSIWLFDAERSCLRRVFFLDRARPRAGGDAGAGASEGAAVTMRREQYPRYFQALEEERVVVVEDVRTDPRTAAFVTYFETRPAAMLDAPVVVAGCCVGVLCVEHIGATRRWSLPEMLLVGSIADLLAQAMQVEEQRQTQALLERKQAELSLALEAASMGTWSWDVAANLVEWSEQVGLIFGRARGWAPEDYEAYLGVVHPDDRELVSEAVSRSLSEGEDGYYIQHRVLVPGAEDRWVEASGQVERDAQGKPTYMRGTVQDVSARRRLEGQLVQAQKLEAVGRLAGGVAHDFNNLLTAIGGAVDMVMLTHEDDTELCAELEQVFEATRRATALTQQLLTFVRERPAQPRVVDLGELIHGLEGLIRRLIGGGLIEVVTELSAESTRVRVDPIQLEQVFINLAVNARDAMPEGGRLTISSRIEQGEEGEEIVVEVRDTGEGMDPEVVRRAFEPFFTTKAAGQGTGLGLATCLEIVQRFGGAMAVDSQLERGTTFWIVLPRVAEPVEIEELEGEVDGAFVGSERVLLVEDDPAVRELAARVLGHYGYAVETAANRAQALVVAEGVQPFDLLIADVVLPGGSGIGLAVELRRRRKLGAVLLMSGYTFENAGTESELPVGARFLAKPFTARGLAAAARAAIEQTKHE